MAFHIVFCNNEHKTYLAMIFRSIAPAAVATNTALQAANIALQAAARSHRDDDEYYDDEPIATTQQRKTKKIKIKGTKKEWIALTILLITLVGAVYLLYLSCISLFA